MGNLIKVLTRDIDHNAAHFFLDFESKSPQPFTAGANGKDAGPVKASQTC